MNAEFEWLTVPSKSRIKVEASPTIQPFPSIIPSSLSATSSSRRGSSTGPSRRQRHYPSLSKTQSDMSSSHPYVGTWSGIRSGSGRSQHPPFERRSSDGEQSAYNSTLNSYMNESYMANMTEGQAEYRPPSSNSSLTSSLTGAMGDSSLSHSRSSRSPPSNPALFGGALPSQELSWPNNQMNLAMSSDSYSGHGNLGFPNMGTPSVNTMQFNDFAGTRNPSPPESLAPPSPPYPQAYADQFNRGQMTMSSRSTVGYGGSSMPTSYPSSADLSMAGGSSDPAQQQIRRLSRRVRELELELHRSRQALDTLRSNVPNPTGLPTPPHSSSFQAGWKARTEARKKLFCSLNRAGNALCAWHDSRRERRAYPPRNAPPGYLNCGCTYDEALFEESLARHGVGSYHPGEMVRMDPALRNPLLKLLEKRYNYKDGDFEHDPIMEEWHEGESPALWEQKAHSGQTVRRRPDPSKDDQRS